LLCLFTLFRGLVLGRDPGGKGGLVLVKIPKVRALPSGFRDQGRGEGKRFFFKKSVIGA
jgi:hypothetical protein